MMMTETGTCDYEAYRCGFTLFSVTAAVFLLSLDRLIFFEHHIQLMSRAGVSLTGQRVLFAPCGHKQSHLPNCLSFALPWQQSAGNQHMSLRFDFSTM